MYGLPHQSLAQWEDTIERLAALLPEHISLYALTLEEGTPMKVWADQGRIPEPDPDLAADMYALAPPGSRRVRLPPLRDFQLGAAGARVAAQPHLLAQRAIPGRRAGGAFAFGGVPILDGSPAPRLRQPRRPMGAVIRWTMARFRGGGTAPSPHGGRVGAYKRRYRLRRDHVSSACACWTGWTCAKHLVAAGRDLATR